MNKFLAVMLGVVASNQAFAADNSGRSPVTWSGAYLGAELGHAWAEGNYFADFGDFTNSARRTLDGAFVGAYGGYNVDLGNSIIVGIEADAALHDTHDEGSAIQDQGIPSPAYIITDQSWSAAARVRGGYAFGRWLPFVAGGVAATRVKVSDAAERRHPLSSTDTYLGWTVGAGVDYALSEHVITRLEYRYTDFGGQALDIPGDRTFDLKSQDVRIGVAYKF
ncbi:porin family protein [Mesorhizobium sp. PAMC28654]|uniref:outer membrane protein n=1 Tax=Mesorhizobium sp. PAMC28654 TaxID=2880934 RepID=UPI001D09EF28|nr:outer membrane protein [Mesorhizobium sp. PAMC28654]UDL88978.1 porin family protein [Mesorhizobium sp. PAMC28654]